MSTVTLFRHPKILVSSKPLISYLSDIKKGKYESVVEPLRDAYFKELDTVFDSQRRQIPRFSIAGNFKSDNYNLELICYSGYLFFEIKYIHPREFNTVRVLLRKNPFVFASFKNALGLGICFIVQTKVDIEDHARVFRRAYRYFSKKLSTCIQANQTKRLSKEGEDIQHLCMMSFDPKAHVNIANIPFPVRAQIKY